MAAVRFKLQGKSMRKIILVSLISVLFLSACLRTPSENPATSEITNAPTQTTDLSPTPTQQPTSTPEPSPTPTAIPAPSINPDTAATIVALETITDHQTPIRNIFIPNTNSFITSSDGQDSLLYLWEKKNKVSNSPLGISEYPFPPIAISPDGKLLAMRILPSSGVDTVMAIFDLSTGEIITQFEFQTDRLSHVINDVQWSPDGNLLAIGNADGHVQAYETETFSRLLDTKIQPDQKDSVARINVVAFSPDGKLLAAAGQDEAIRIWDTADWNEPKVIDNSMFPILDLEFSPDGKFIVVGDAGEIYVWDLENEKEVEGFNPQFKTFTVAYSPDGSLLAAGGIDRRVRIWRTDTWEMVAELTGHKTKVISLEFSFDGQFLVSASEGAGPEYPSTVILWGLP